MYVVHIAAFLGILVIAGGFVVLHFAKQENSTPLNAAALILLIGGALGLGCIVYYSASYWQQGYFTTPMPMHNNMPMKMPMHQPD